MSNQWFWRCMRIVALLVSLSVTGCIQAIITPAPLAITTGDPNKTMAFDVTFEINEQGLSGPTEVPSGLVNVTFQNSGQAPHLLFVELLAEGVSAPPDDPSQSSHVNGLFLAPGSRVEAMLYFTANRHYFVFEAFVEKPHFVEFAATGTGATNTAPNAAVVVETVDFAYVMPDEIKAGVQWWQVSNTGKQPHDLGIHKLEGDLTLETLMTQYAAAEEQGQAPPAVSVIPSWGVGAGQTTWVKFDLPAGKYVVFCRVPDFSTTPPGPAHWHQGMVWQFTVVE